MRKNALLGMLLVSLMLLVSPVLAHTPLEPGDNEELETATVVTDPTKSWAVYAELHEEGEAQYYRLDLNDGERLKAMLYIPIAEKGFKPNLVIMGPGISSQDTVPEYVEVPDGAGVILVEAEETAMPEYEPFTPSSYYYPAEYDLEISVPGEYFIAVYEPDRGGRYGLAIGYREEFGVDEWLLIPLDVIDIHQWEGQPLALIIAPMLIALAAGLLTIVWLKRHLLQRIGFWLAALAGLLFIGSGFMTLAQMLIALSSATFDASAALTIVFAVLPILLGIGILKLAARDNMTAKTRSLVALFGLSGLIVWAGVLIGPVLALLASIIPTFRMRA